jgi:short-subunit dehydrogenase
MATSLQGKVAIVTGASDGMGREIAYLLGKEGAKVALAARREDRLREVAQQVEASGGKALVVPTDLRKTEDLQNLVAATLKEYGRIDILLNVAGMGYFEWMEEITADELREQFEVNVVAMAELIRQVVPVMKVHRSGHIVNFASYASRIAAPPMVVYASTKYAIEGLTDGLRRELAPWGIKMTRVHPSAVDTQFNPKAARHGGILYPYDKLTGVTKEKVAQMVVKSLKHYRKAVYCSRFRPLSELGVTAARYLPFILDWALKPRVKKMWKEHADHDTAPDLVALHQRRA